MLFFLLEEEKQLVFFDNELSYLHPVTGEKLSKNLFTLKSEAVDECIKLFELFEPLVSGSASNTDTTLYELKGKSLDTGMVDSCSSDGSYYAEKKPPLKGI